MLNQNFPTQKKCRIASPQHTKSPNIPTPEPGTREAEHTSPASYANSSRGFVHKLKSGLRTQTQVGASYATHQISQNTTPEPGTRETEHTSPASYANSSRGFVHKLKSGLRTQTQVGASYAMFMSGSDFIHPDDCEVLTAAQDSRLPPDMTYAVPPARARGSLHQLALSARARWALHQPLLPLLPLPLLPLPASPATTHNFVRLSVSKLLLTGAASALFLYTCSLFTPTTVLSTWEEVAFFVLLVNSCFNVLFASDQLFSGVNGLLVALILIRTRRLNNLERHPLFQLSGSSGNDTGSIISTTSTTTTTSSSSSSANYQRESNGTSRRAAMDGGTVWKSKMVRTLQLSFVTVVWLYWLLYASGAAEFLLNTLYVKCTELVCLAVHQYYLLDTAYCVAL